MTAYELGDLINGVVNNIIAGQAVWITILSAYLVVAYTVGANLTRYQVWFISLVFFLFAFVGFNSQLSLLGMSYEYAEQRNALIGSDKMRGASDDITFWVFMSVRVLITLGAFIFMWQVRHPKTE